MVCWWYIIALWKLLKSNFSCLTFFNIREKEIEIRKCNPCPYSCQDLLCSVGWTCGLWSFCLSICLSLSHLFVNYLIVMFSFSFRSGHLQNSTCKSERQLSQNILKLRKAVLWSGLIEQWLLNIPVYSNYTHFYSFISSPPRIHQGTETHWNSVSLPPFMFAIEF